MRAPFAGPGPAQAIPGRVWVEDKRCFLCFKLEMEAVVAIQLGKGVRVDVVGRPVNRCSSQLYVHMSASRGRQVTTAHRPQEYQLQDPAFVGHQ